MLPKPLFPILKTNLYVDHIDTDILNNHVDNLRWVTPKENMNNEETKKNIRKAKENTEGVPTLQVDIASGNIIKEFISASAAARELNIVTHCTVAGIRNYYHMNMRDTHQ